MKYVATINVPGYLPNDDEPPVFDTPADAWLYLEEERDNAEAETTDDGIFVSSDCLEELQRLSRLAPGAIAAASVFTPEWDGLGTVYGPTPGYDGDHDLGLAYSVDYAEEETAAA